MIRGNSGAIEETRIFIIIVIIFSSQAKREFQRAILQSKASNPPISAKAAQVDLGNIPRTWTRAGKEIKTLLCFASRFYYDGYEMGFFTCRTP